jgi:cysteine desulfurase
MDYAATTPVDPRVADKMAACLTLDGTYANPASGSHVLGRAARVQVENARAQVAQLIGASSDEIIWTSGATESNNLAIKGAARFHADKGRHIISSRTEHKAVLDTCRQLEREGFSVTYLVPGSSGIIDPRQVEEAMLDDTILVSIMHVNNEIGVVQDIAAIGRLCRARGVLFHVDAAQSAGKLAIDVGTMPADLMSLSGHKVYGPKGIGALYACSDPRANIEPLMHGGGHEQGLRPGTLPTHQVVGMGEAFRLAAQELDAESVRLRSLRDKLWNGIAAAGGVESNGSRTASAPGLLNVTIDGVEGESLLLALRDLAISSGSACTSATGETSYVLRALGRPDYLAQSSIRLSLGRFTTEAEIEFAIDVIRAQVARLRRIAADPV